MTDPDAGARTAAVTPVPVGERAASAIYGTIVVTAVIVALSEDPGADAGELIEAAATTTLVFWLAHTYSEILGPRAAVHDASLRVGIRPALLREVSMVGAAIPPVAALALAAMHFVSRTHAVTIALVVGVFELFVWGYLAGRRPGSSVLRSAAIGLFNCVLGVAIVLLKALIH